MGQHFIPRTDAETDLLACAAYIAESIIGGEAKAAAIASVVPAYLRRGNVDLAAELANSVDDPFTRDRLLTAVAEKCAELKDDEYALQLAEAIEESGSQAQAFERIGIVKANLGDIEKAREVSALMVHPDSVLASIAVKQAENGDVANAFKTVGEIEYPGAAVSALNRIAAKKIEDENTESLLVILDRSLQEASKIEHNEERIGALIGIGDLFIRFGDNTRAVETFEKARVDAEALDNIHRDSFLGRVSLGFLHSGSIDLADRTLDAVADKTQIASVLFGFARDYWRKEELDEAFEALEEAHAILKSQRETETRDSKARFSLMGQIAAQFAGFGKGERALEIAETIDDDAQRTAALQQISSIGASQSNDDLARLALNSLGEIGDRVMALIGMSDAKRENDPVLAQELLTEAMQLAGEVPQPGLRASGLIALIARFSGPDRLHLSHAALLEVLKLTGQVRGDDTRTSILADLSATVEDVGLDLNESEREANRSVISN